ncbi:MAG: AAA family ATPase [Salinivirgaceae bacterium]|jgi:predicted ATPase
MSKIKIYNFGPIKQGYQDNDGWIDVKKVTLFIGNQGSGKSTVAKLITTFLWIEKALTRGDYDKKWFTRKNKLKNQFLTYFRIDNYFPNVDDSNQPYIEYLGDSFHIVFENGTLNIEEIKGKYYPLPQIMYVPAERNFISYVKNTKELKIASDSLREFLAEFEKAKNEVKGSIKLPINDVDLEYDKLNDVLNIKGKVQNIDYKVRLIDASSGFQSTVPLFLVSSYLANSVKNQSLKQSEPMSGDELDRFKKNAEEILSNNNLTYEQQRVALSILSSKFNKTAFINIVEEPEQNLFPSSQRQILNKLLEFNNMNAGNKLIMTSHSPYLINYLTHSVKASIVLEKIEKSNKKSELKEKLNKVVPINSIIKPTDWVVYELNEADGSIIKLDNYKDLPSDENYLNESLGKSNDIFINLLELEDLCQ